MRKRRYITAIASGAAAEVVTCILLWLVTDLPIHAVAFWAVLAYFVGIVAVAFWRPRRRRKKKRKPSVFVTFELDAVEWYTGLFNRRW